VSGLDLFSTLWFFKFDLSSANDLCINILKLYILSLQNSWRVGERIACSWCSCLKDLR
jgi:hypothetical protein